MRRWYETLEADGATYPYAFSIGDDGALKVMCPGVHVPLAYLAPKAPPELVRAAAKRALLGVVRRQRRRGSTG
jgi:hypothetical protein